MPEVKIFTRKTYACIDLLMFGLTICAFLYAPALQHEYCRFKSNSDVGMN